MPMAWLFVAQLDPFQGSYFRGCIHWNLPLELGLRLVYWGVFYLIYTVQGPLTHHKLIVGKASLCWSVRTLGRIRSVKPMFTTRLDARIKYDHPTIIGLLRGGGGPRGGGSLIFPKVPQSSLGILRVPQLPPP